jgi:molybdopterin/thiamine biosynthesis adenylyltransferase
MNKPVLRQGWRVLKRQDGDLYLGRSMHFFKLVEPQPGTLEYMLSLMDGNHSMPMIVAEMAEKYPGLISEADCVRIIQQLEAAKVLYEGDVPPPSALSAYDLERYDRQIRFWISYEDISVGNTRYSFQTRLKASHVAVVGIGGLGSWITFALASAGIGQVTALDPDTVSLSNLNRQILYNERAIGRPKVEVAGETLASFNHDLKYKGIREAVVDVESAKRLLDGVDLVVLAADHPPSHLRRWVTRACMELQIPHIIIGGSLLGPLVDPFTTACFGCYEAFLRERDRDYDGFVNQVATARPTQTAASFMSPIVGGLIAKDAILFLAKAGKPTTLGQVVRFDWEKLSSLALPLERRNDCPLCGTGASAHAQPA